jgi:RHS repeat-associated protein
LSRNIDFITPLKIEGDIMFISKGQKIFITIFVLFAFLFTNAGFSGFLFAAELEKQEHKALISDNIIQDTLIQTDNNLDLQEATLQTDDKSVSDFPDQSEPKNDTAMQQVSYKKNNNIKDSLTTKNNKDSYDKTIKNGLHSPLAMTLREILKSSTNKIEISDLLFNDSDIKNINAVSGQVSSINLSYPIKNKGGLYTAGFSRQSGKGLLEFSHKNASILMTPLNASTVNSKVCQNTVYFEDIYPNTDYRYTAGQYFLKEDIIVKNFTGMTDFYFQYTVNNAVSQASSDGEIYFFDPVTKATLFRMAKPYALDNDGNRCDNLKLEVTENGLIKLSVDPDWLKKAVYPVVIDPSIFIGGETYSNYDFSNTQEHILIQSRYNGIPIYNTWNYEEQQPDGTYNLIDVFDQSNDRWVGSDGTSYISMDCQYPGINNAVKTWIAPHSGVVQIYDYVGMSCECTGDGDGINVKIMKNDTQLWPSNGWQYIADDLNGTYTTHSSIIPVDAGDKIRFIVNGNENTNDDYNVWEQYVSYIDDYNIASIGYSDTQGQNNWYYEERRTDGQYYPMSWDSSNNYWVGTTGNIVDRSWQLPASNDAVRTWKAPYSGIVSVSGDFYKMDTIGGDGVYVCIYKNNTEVGLRQLIPYDSTSKNNFQMDIPVNCGDKIRFIVNQNSNSQSDKTGFEPTIAYYQLHNTNSVKPYWNYITLDLGNGWDSSVNTFNRNLVLSKPIFSIPEQGLSMEEKVTYNRTDKRGGPLGVGWHLGSDITIVERPDGNVVLTDSDGSINVFTPDGSGGYNASPGTYFTLQKLGSGNFKITDNKQNIYTFQNNKISQVSDSNGNITTYTYSDGQLTRITDPSGRSITYDYNSNNRIVAIHDPAGNTYSFSYDTSYNDYLQSITDPQNNIVTFDAWNPNGLNFTDSLNRGTCFGGNDMITNIRDARTNGSNIYQTNLSQTIQDGSIITTVTDPSNHVCTYYHNPDTGYVTSIKDALNHTTTFAYDDDFNLISKIDPLGRVNHATYDTNGNILIETDPMNYITTYSYDANNYLLSTTDALGHTTNYSYDIYGNMLSDGTKTYTYNTNGSIATITDAKGNITNYTYDLYGNVISITDSTGKSTQYTYDSIGRKLTEEDANGNITSYTYDNLGRMLTIDVPDGAGSSDTTSYAYDANGNRLTLTDAAGNITSWTYDVLNRLTSTAEPGNRINNTTYDIAGNVSSETDFDGRVTTYSYDSVNRLTQVNYPDGRVVTYSYDAVGNKISMTDASGTTSYEYNANNNLIREISSSGRTITYTYDANNKMTGKSFNGLSVTFNYDSSGNLTSLVDSINKITEFGYDLNMNRTAINYASGAKVNYSYDSSDMITGVRNLGPTGNVLSSFDYTYYDNGQVKTVIDSNGLITYDYDEQSRLIKTTYPTGNMTDYTYDSVGNRTSVVDIVYGVTATTLYTYDMVTNQLTSITKPDGSTVSYTYDTNGNTLTKIDGIGTTSYVYNASNQLIKVIKPNGDVIEYAYDGDNRRISKSVNDILTKYVYDEDRIIYETDANGIMLRYYVYDNTGLPISTTKGKQKLYYHYNGHGDVIALTDSSGNVVSTYEYDIWGNVKSITGNIDTPFGYVGQYGYIYDKETELYFLNSRYYDPKIGRFTTKDRFKGFEDRPATQNQYTYCENDPVNLIDPTGYWSYDFFRRTYLGCGGWISAYVYLYFSKYGKKGTIYLNCYYKITAGALGLTVGTIVSGAVIGKKIAAFVIKNTFTKEIFTKVLGVTLGTYLFTKVINKLGNLVAKSLKYLDKQIIKIPYSTYVIWKDTIEKSFSW